MLMAFTRMKLLLEDDNPKWFCMVWEICPTDWCHPSPSKSLTGLTPSAWATLHLPCRLNKGHDHELQTQGCCQVVEQRGGLADCINPLAQSCADFIAATDKQAAATGKQAHVRQDHNQSDTWL